MHLQSIENILEYLKINHKKYLIIFNKIDILKNKKLIKNLKILYPDSLFVSSNKGIGINSIILKIKKNMNKGNINKIINLPYNKFHFVDRLYSEFTVLNREDKKNNMKFKVFGNKDKINKIVSEIKKWVCIIR